MIGSFVLSLGDVWMLIAHVFVMFRGMFVIHLWAGSEGNHNAPSLRGFTTGFMSHVIRLVGRLALS